ncbi:succinylglutamate desuccinylase [Marinomonas sp. C2222]|uniref:Succinylglutamate desuccinylase n=1 Tax=Marinomonas sargassi TaxID=2984494 RepID=A0ABT2YQ66_9GAMM|nr:succinylglutamate desuccinylase [Marinomonas sargassi]MCV2401834.1 succinylglutamate desuccinylase [Marinomonas sargassi]
MFKQSFLFDTLDLTTEMPTAATKAVAGGQLKLIRRGVLEVTPSEVNEATKSIVISAGVHGNETTPLELVDAIVNDILAGTFEIKERCLFILAYPKAINNKTRFLDENLNRLFYKEVAGESVEVDIAKELMADVSAFFAPTPESQRWHLDLHCAIRKSEHFTFAVSPHTLTKTRSRELFSFIDKAQLDAVLLSQGKTNTFSCFSANTHNAQALTVELGQVSPLGENDLSLVDGFNLALRALLCGQLDTIEATSKSIIYGVCQTLTRTQEDFDFTFDAKVKNFTRFYKGDELGHDGETTLTVKQEYEAVVFPNKDVALGSRAALMVTEVNACFNDDYLEFSLPNS